MHNQAARSRRGSSAARVRQSVADASATTIDSQRLCCAQAGPRNTTIATNSTRLATVSQRNITTVERQRPSKTAVIGELRRRGGLTSYVGWPATLLSRLA